jgi:hypothetical protein
MAVDVDDARPGAALDPTPACHGIHRQTTLRHHLLHVAIAERLPQIPTPIATMSRKNTPQTCGRRYPVIALRND